MKSRGDFPACKRMNKVVLLPASAHITHCNTAGVEVAEGGRAEHCPKYRVDYGNDVTVKELARKMWQKCLVIKVSFFLVAVTCVKRRSYWACGYY